VLSSKALYLPDAVTVIFAMFLLEIATRNSIISLVEHSLKGISEIATAVAALEVQTKGAIPAMPYRENVFKFLEEKGFKYE
jgi:sugar/nucleoside kinase (ribokinase family)